MSTDKTNLTVRLDDESKSYIARAARIRQTSMSKYVRIVSVEQAKREGDTGRPKCHRAYAYRTTRILECVGFFTRVDRSAERLGQSHARRGN